MASFGIFLHLAVLCFFIVRYADSYGYNRGYNPYNRGYNPYNRGYNPYNKGYNPYNKAGGDDKGGDYGYNPYNRGYAPPPSYGYKKHEAMDTTKDTTAIKDKTGLQVQMQLRWWRYIG